MTYAASGARAHGGELNEMVEAKFRTLEDPGHATRKMHASRTLLACPYDVPVVF